MKKILLNLSVVTLLASCGGNSEAVVAKEVEEKAPVVQAAEVDVYAVNVDSSVVNWEGKKLTGTHAGVVTIQSGSVSVLNGAVSGAEVVIDLTTIKELGADSAYAVKLVGHLSSPDFFNVDSFPTATIVVTEIKDGTAKADLTIKGKTKSIEFAATTTLSEVNITVQADFTINRTDWGIVYGSGNFMDLAKDKVINDDISFSVNLTAKK